MNYRGSPLSPHAFFDVGEEVLRFHFLVQPNGVFEGQATGETFNFQGKTDILIRADGKSIFIAECKFWKGENSFIETIDQLLSYLSWRDTKATVVVFNRNADFSGVFAKIRPGSVGLETVDLVSYSPLGTERSGGKRREWASPAARRKRFVNNFRRTWLWWPARVCLV
jgi:hypothetical protein